MKRKRLNKSATKFDVILLSPFEPHKPLQSSLSELLESPLSAPLARGRPTVNMQTRIGREGGDARLAGHECKCGGCRQALNQGLERPRLAYSSLKEPRGQHEMCRPVQVKESQYLSIDGKLTSIVIPFTIHVGRGYKAHSWIDCQIENENRAFRWRQSSSTVLSKGVAMGNPATSKLLMPPPPNRQPLALESNNVN